MKNMMSKTSSPLSIIEITKDTLQPFLLKRTDNDKLFPSKLISGLQNWHKVSHCATLLFGFCTFRRWEPQNKEYLQNDQQAIPHSSVIFVAPYWRYRISCLKVQLAPLAQGADSEMWNVGLDLGVQNTRPIFPTQHISGKGPIRVTDHGAIDD